MARGIARRGFDLDLQDGEYAEGRLAELLRLHGDQIEVKDDQQAKKTGNVFVELRQQGRPGGLATTTAAWWGFFTGPDRLALVSTERLRDLTRRAASEQRVTRGGDFDGYDGVLVPVAWLLA